MNLPETEPQDDDEGWSKGEEQPKRNKGIQCWRQRLGILRGTAISENDEESLSADVHLVAYSIAKNVTGIQLSHLCDCIHNVHCKNEEHKREIDARCPAFIRMCC